MRHPGNRGSLAHIVALGLVASLASGVAGCAGDTGGSGDAALPPDADADAGTDAGVDANTPPDVAATTGGDGGDGDATAAVDAVAASDADDGGSAPDALVDAGPLDEGTPLDARPADGGTPDVAASPDVAPVDAVAPDATVADATVADAADAAPTDAVARDVTAMDAVADAPRDAAPDAVVADAPDGGGSTLIVQLASAEYFTCARRANGTVWCWGTGNQGQLGDPTAGSVRVPMQVAGITDAVEITAGVGFACARRAGGTVLCWGEGRSGQLGIGTTTGIRVPPTPVSMLTDAQQLTAGSAHACALRAGGTVVCWGGNTSGQVGDGTMGTNRLVPTAVTGLTGVAEVAAGGTHTCARLAAGAVRCWGGNASGQLGDGTMGANRLAPVAVSNLTDAAELTAGNVYTCARRANRSVVCWGGNASGQLGDGTMGTSRLAPVAVMGVTDATQLDSGQAHNCARRATGAVVCWGSNDGGQIGDAVLGPNRLVATPVLGIADATETVAGWAHSCALRGGGAVVTCWGDGLYSQYGDGQPGALRPVPSTPVQGISDAVQIAASGPINCARRPGSVSCWGRNDVGQLGDGTPVAGRSLPVTVRGLTDAVDIVGGTGSYACARRPGGAAVCWGDNRAGQLGDGTRTHRTTPTPVVGVTDVTQIALATFNTCVVRRTGAVACWGDNLFGQVGNGSSGNVSIVTPTPVVGITNAVEVGAGFATFCARRTSGGTVCWGRNDRGQVGDGTLTNRSTPVVIPELADAVELGGGFNHMCARRNNGTVLCWGANGNGELGDGTTAERTRPVPVMGLTDAVEIAVGNATTCARRRDNSVVCWGPGTNPDGTAMTRRMATPVLGLTDVAELAAGQSTICARRTSGVVVCWGSNERGQVGIGPLRNVAF